MIKTGAAPVGAGTLVIDCTDIAVGRVSCSSALSASQTFNVWGQLAAGGPANLVNLGPLFGSSAGTTAPVAPLLGLSWSFLTFTRVLGADAGEIEVEGVPWVRTDVSEAIPVVANTFSNVLDYGDCGHQYAVQLDPDATAADRQFVYATNDLTPRTNATGTTPLGEIRGGGWPAMVVTGWRYLIVKCLAHGAATALNGSANAAAGSGGGGVLPVPIAIPATPSTLAERDAAGGLQATSFSGAGVAADGFTVVGSSVGASPTTVQGGTDGLMLTSEAVQLSADTEANIDGPSIRLGFQSPGTTLQLGRPDAAVAVDAGNGGFSFNGAGGTAADFSIKPGQTGKVRLLPRYIDPGDTASLAFYELAANGTNFAALKAPDALAGDTTYTLPTAFPAIAGQSLTSSTAGVMSWSGAINVQATNTSAQVFADGGAPAAITGWTESVDTAGAFNAATGEFLVPIAGRYQFDVGSQWAATAAALGVTFSCSIAIGGSAIVGDAFVNPVDTLAEQRTLRYTFTLTLTAAQVVTIIGSVSANGGTDIALTASAVFNQLSITKVG